MLMLPKVPLLAVTSPLTCNVLVGLFVPIPTLPTLSTRNLSTPLVLTPKVFAAGLNKPVSTSLINSKEGRAADPEPAIKDTVEDTSPLKVLVHNTWNFDDGTPVPIPTFPPLVITKSF